MLTLVMFSAQHTQGMGHDLMQYQNATGFLVPELLNIVDFFMYETSVTETSADLSCSRFTTAHDTLLTLTSVTERL